MYRSLIIAIMVLLSGPVCAQDVGPALQPYLEAEAKSGIALCKTKTSGSFLVMHPLIRPKSRNGLRPEFEAGDLAGSLEKSVLTMPRLVPYRPADEFGFFCQWEWKVEKRSGIAPRFRLGSWEEAQRLEGKL